MRHGNFKNERLPKRSQIAQKLLELSDLYFKVLLARARLGFFFRDLNEEKPKFQGIHKPPPFDAAEQKKRRGSDTRAHDNAKKKIEDHLRSPRFSSSG